MQAAPAGRADKYAWMGKVCLLPCKRPAVEQDLIADNLCLPAVLAACMCSLVLTQRITHLAGHSPVLRVGKQDMHSIILTFPLGPGGSALQAAAAYPRMPLPAAARGSFYPLVQPVKLCHLGPAQPVCTYVSALVLHRPRGEVSKPQARLLQPTRQKLPRTPRRPNQQQLQQPLLRLPSLLQVPKQPPKQLPLLLRLQHRQASGPPATFCAALQFMLVVVKCQGWCIPGLISSLRLISDCYNHESEACWCC